MAIVDTINRHVGHRVEITASQSPDSPVGTSGRADAEPPSAAPPPVLKVESVKMLSSTCGVSGTNVVTAADCDCYFAYCSGFLSNFVLQICAQK